MSDKNTQTIELPQSELDRQRAYVAKKVKEGDEFNMIVADAFIRGIRDIGYKSTATALDELVDNSVQAGADQIDIVFRFAGNSDKKPDAIAIVDNGHGMDKEMIRFAVTWGGTHRENDRGGFGRYGYGLPSASVSQGKSFTVFSRPRDGEWHKVTVDLDKLINGQNGSVSTPAATKAKLPAFLTNPLRGAVPDSDLAHGTVVLIEKLDRLTWSTTKGLERNLLQHIGVVYRNFLNDVRITVNGKTVEPIDPLFTTPGHRFYDLDEDRAEELPPLHFEVTETKSNKPGTVKVRFAYLPPTFARKDKTSERGEKNARLAVMSQYGQGILVMRNGRQIDTVQTGCPWTRFVNNDRYWGVEVDFSPELDEEFSITTSKQQIVLSDRMWQLLKQHGVLAAIKELRARYKKENAAWKQHIQSERDSGAKRASETIMEEAEKFKTRAPAGDPEERKKRNREQLEQEVKRRARKTGQSPDTVRNQLTQLMDQRRYVVEEEDLPGAPFYRPAQLGGVKVLFLNVGHPFYTDVYGQLGNASRIQSALELLLFVLADAELDSADDRRRFYESERVEWTRALRIVLEQLGEDADVEDAVEAQEVEEEDAEGAANEQPSLFGESL